MKICTRRILILNAYLVFVSISCYPNSENEIQDYKKELEKRLTDYKGMPVNLPEIIFSGKIHSNAQYEGEKILIGKRFFSDSYFSKEDRLSILLHEYIHYLIDINNICAYKQDKKGIIIQVKTDIFYKKDLSKTKTEKDFSEMEKSGVSKEIIDQFKKETNKPAY